ncbi:hypothetical protein D1007_56144 [Hordeum vulgare]|nr:hypothetical protein D1007_56144 [Hordeum vulgare]
MLSSLELRARQALCSIHMMWLESSFVPQDAGYTEFSYDLMKELEGAVKKVGHILEQECPDLFSVAKTRVFNHLLLHDPHFEFEEVMGPVRESPVVIYRLPWRATCIRCSRSSPAMMMRSPARSPLPCLETNYLCLREA